MLTTSKKSNPIELFLAKQFLKFSSPSNFIAILGDVGKTTTLNACVQVLTEKFACLTNQETSLSKMILKSKAKNNKSLVEISYENLSEPDLLQKVKVETTLITRLTPYSQDKTAQILKSFDQKGLVISNYDDILSRKLAQNLSGQSFFYGTDYKNCSIWAGNIKVNNFHTKFELNYGVERVEIRTELLGVYQIYALLAAAALGLNYGIPLIKIKKAIENVKIQDHHLQPIVGHNDSIILDDTYDATAETVDAALDTLNQLSARRRILVLGELKINNKDHLASKSDKEKTYRELASKIYKDKIDLVLLLKGETQIVFDELNKLGFIPDRMQSDLQNPQIVSNLLKILSRGDIVLITGSSNLRLDEVVKKVAKL